MIEFYKFITIINYEIYLKYLLLPNCSYSLSISTSCILHFSFRVSVLVYHTYILGLAFDVVFKTQVSATRAIAAVNGFSNI